MKVFLLISLVLCFGLMKIHAETQFFFAQKADLTVAADGSAPKKGSVGALLGGHTKKI